MIEQARVWQCDYCPSRYTQEGPRGASLPPVPPEGWHYVSITKLIPAHSYYVGKPDAQGKREKAKIGDQLDDVRKTLCPSCRPRLDSLVGE